jgi:DNA-binding GntR family transcriptional regulator
VAAHASFHRALVAGCDNPVLLDVWQKLYDAAELYRQWSVPAGAAVRERRDVPAEHQALLDAALAHDIDRAVALLGEHDHRTAALILAAHRAQRQGMPPTA